MKLQTYTSRTIDDVKISTNRSIKGDPDHKAHRELSKTSSKKHTMSVELY